jgi:hypothetical protein
VLFYSPGKQEVTELCSGEDGERHERKWRYARRVKI